MNTNNLTIAKMIADAISINQHDSLYLFTIQDMASVVTKVEDKYTIVEGVDMVTDTDLIKLIDEEINNTCNSKANAIQVSTLQLPRPLIDSMSRINELDRMDKELEDNFQRYIVGEGQSKTLTSNEV